MDAPHLTPSHLAARLRLSGVTGRMAELLVVALSGELGADALREHDPDAARRLSALLEDPARQAVMSAINRLVFDALEAIDGAPDLRQQLARLHPDLGMQ